MNHGVGQGRFAPFAPLDRFVLRQSKALSSKTKRASHYATPLIHHPFCPIRGGLAFELVRDFAPGVRRVVLTLNRAFEMAPDSIAIVLWMMSLSSGRSMFRRLQATHAAHETAV